MLTPKKTATPRQHSWRGRKNDVRCRHCGMVRAHIVGDQWVCQTKDGKALQGSDHACPPVVPTMVDHFRNARQAAIDATKGLRDEGTCNFDSLAVKSTKETRDALQGAVLRFHQGSGRMWRGYVLVEPPVAGQGYVRTRQAEVMERLLKAQGVEVTVYYQMD